MRVLIVDDSRTCRRLYRKELEKGGYEVLEATDGVEALHVVHQQEIDLVILDIEMPNMDGYETCERLRSQEFTARFHKDKDGLLPVIFVTSNESLEVRVKGFNKGADDFITKGFKPGTLLTTVNTVLKPANPMTGLTALVVEDSRFVRNMVSNFLREQGIQVLEASDGIEAFDLLCENIRDINMVITDLEMPNMNGDELCKKVRRDLGLKGIPVIILTATDERDLLLNLFEAGATDYLVKPFEKQELFARLKVSLEIINQLKREIEERRKAEEDLKRSKALMEAHAEAAGVAEFATSVLHNIGNVLNSVYVSCFQLTKEIQNSKLSQMLLAHQLLEENMEDLPKFLKEDPKGQMLPHYLLKIGKKIESEQINIAREIDEMATKINLMKDIIDTQQAHAKGDSDWEEVNLEEVVREALKVQAENIRKYEIAVRKTFTPMATVQVQRINLAHIVINLIKNAAEAMRESPDRVLTIRTGENEDQLAFLTVTDTGVGMTSETLASIFMHGFTTKPDGHGFGLSYCLKTMKNMGGRIKAKSKGEGKGATFTILFGVDPPTDL